MNSPMERLIRITCWTSLVLLGLSCSVVPASGSMFAQIGNAVASMAIDECVDDHPLCPFWKSSPNVGCEGYNKAFMQKHCSGSCSTDSCAGSNMLNYTCEDTHPRCAEWAKRGECENNPQYMYWQCLKTCSACGENPAGSLISLPPSVYDAHQTELKAPLTEPGEELPSIPQAPHEIIPEGGQTTTEPTGQQQISGNDVGLPTLEGNNIKH